MNNRKADETMEFRDSAAHYTRDKVTSVIVSRQGHTGNALPGYTFGYGFDTIGNRLQAEREVATDTYTPNPLNQMKEI